MPILTYIKLGVLAVALLAVAYFVMSYRGLRNEVKEQAAALAISAQKLEDAVAEHNAAMSKLQESFYAEREQRKLSERNYSEANDKIADLMTAAQDEKAKYESGRLARLSAAKPGLLTRLAKTGAQRRNSEWEGMAEWAK